MVEWQKDDGPGGAYVVIYGRRVHARDMIFIALFAFFAAIILLPEVLSA